MFLPFIYTDTFGATNMYVLRCGQQIDKNYPYLRYAFSLRLLVFWSDGLANLPLLIENMTQSR